jgi:hypothetical protein
MHSHLVAVLLILLDGEAEEGIDAKLLQPEGFCDRLLNG